MSSNAVIESGSDKDVKDVTEQSVEQSKPVSRFTRWYRSPLFNVIIVDTGAGGQQEPYLVNGANSLTFGIMVFGCSIFSILANKIGLKWVLVIGTLGYAPYSAALYTNNRYGVEWFVLLGGATCGIGASALWASEGAIALGYGDVKDPGIWLGLRELGQLIGSSIQLSLNVESGKRGRVGYTTYLVLIALQCLGLPLALLVSPPNKVIRPDGSKLPYTQTNKSIKEQCRRWGALIKRKQFFLLIPILVGFNWNSTYLGIYLVNYFSVRARALASLTSGIAATGANIFWGWFFDLKYFSRPQLARITWVFLAVTMTALFGWQFAMELEYRSANPAVTLDWDLPGFGRGFAVQVLLRFMNESHYMFVYWIIGTFFEDVETLTLAVGLVRSFESLGSCLAFGVGAAKVPSLTNLIVAFVMFCISLPSTSFAVFLVPERPANHVLDKDNESEE
ncbi:hypothetical protein BFJ68_g5056 [Fusarium oxysporum]|uniref:DUF895 domain membrane protein n=1 Tax=Fusarium oxysporum TaxID=5507 RepID=A0A420RHD1_FUSOX|nr:hypothetical protein BFJ68_g5056 [Fusarium oxysporum]